MNFVAKPINLLTKKYIKYLKSRLIPTNKSNRKLLISGWTSSGSTFIYQIAKLLEVDVSKEHGFISDANYFLKLFTIRDPRDIITSNAKRVSKEIWENDGKEKALREALFRFLNGNFREDYYKALKDRNSLIVRYELFVPRKNEDILISFLADQFGILLNEKQLNNIIKNTSIEKNVMRASRNVNFKSWDEETQIHGDHITGGGKVGNWKHCFTNRFILLFKEKLGNLLIELGYEEDNNWGLKRSFDKEES